MGWWSSLLHPRAPAGSSGGGQFSASGGSGAKKPKKGAKGKKRKRHARKRAPGKGTLGFQAGYGSPHGDARVRALQQRLNALGVGDAGGRPLVIDGKLGPKTTAAIKSWQRKNGMAPTGTINAAALRKLTGARSKTSHLRASKTSPRPVKAPMGPTGPGGHP
jgi:putative chitinase